jgi:hypothetical protein
MSLKNLLAELRRGSMRDEMTQQLFRRLVRTKLKLDEASLVAAEGH